MNKNTRLRSLIQNPIFLFFLSSGIISLILYFPTIVIYVLLWLLYLNLSSTTKNEASNVKETNLEEDYYDFLKLLDDQKKSNHSSELISKFQKCFVPNITNSSPYTSEELLYILIENIISAEHKKQEFSFDEWIKSDKARVLPPGIDKEFVSFVKNNREDIQNIKLDKETQKEQLKLILDSKPNPDIIPFNQKDYPKHFQNRILSIKKNEENDNNKQNKYSEIKAEWLWDLIHGDVESFITFNEYSTWYPTHSNYPFWLIPFMLFRWWTPENNSFIDKFILFENLQILPETTKANMFSDPFYLFLSAYVKEKTSLSPILEIARLSSIINNKFEAYILIGILKEEGIITVDQRIYEEVVIQCVNFLFDQKNFKCLSIFVLNKENYQTQLKQLLETYYDDFENEKDCLFAPYNKENGRFRIDRKLFNKIKGEKIISKLLRTSSKKDFKNTFDRGIKCLFDAEDYSRIIQLLVDYYLKYVAEVGSGHESIADKYNELKQKYPFSEVSRKKKENEKLKEKYQNEKGQKQKSEISKRIQENETEYQNYMILDAVSTCFNQQIGYEDTFGQYDKNYFEEIRKILRGGWKSYTLRRFVCSVLMKYKCWQKYLMEINDCENIYSKISTSGIPEDEILTCENVYDLEKISQACEKDDETLNSIY